MDSKLKNSSEKQTKENGEKNIEDVALTEKNNLLKIKKEINLTLKDLFDNYDKRIEKIELFLFDKESKDARNRPKAPEHCYN